jgi:hypothetical protein
MSEDQFERMQVLVAGVLERSIADAQGPGRSRSGTARRERRRRPGVRSRVTRLSSQLEHVELYLGRAADRIAEL